jgi:effector-binding domain-containing protein
MEPKIEERGPQPYAGIREQTAPDGIPAVVDRGFPELFGWLGERGLAPAAAPFIRYHALGATFDLELGVPVAAAVEPAGRVAPGELPAGRWATVVHAGPYSGLQTAWDALGGWVREHGEAPDAEGGVHRGFVEHYLTDPSAEPDSARWETELALLLR